MPDEISYDSPYNIPIGVLIGYFVLTLLNWTLRNAKTFRTEKLQQENLALLEKSLSSPDIREGIQGETCVLQTNREINAATPTKFEPESGTGRDSATRTVDFTKDEEGKGTFNNSVENATEVFQPSHLTTDNDKL